MRSEYSNTIHPSESLSPRESEEDPYLLIVCILEYLVLSFCLKPGRQMETKGKQKADGRGSHGHSSPQKIT